MENKHTYEDLYMLQALPLEVKILKTRKRIKEWVDHYGRDGIYVSFSGGKDSTVLLDIVRKDYPDTPAVFVDTGLEYPEVREFVKTIDNVTIVKPEKNFRQIIEECGYPFISKEVSNCVRGARRYLNDLETWAGDDPERKEYARQNTITEIPYYYNYDRLVGRGQYAKSDDRGGDI